MKKIIVILILVILAIVGYFSFRGGSGGGISNMTVSGKTDLITVDEPLTKSLISSPVTISGFARGYWFFEASFPIEIQDSKGNKIGQGIGQPQEEWMTEEMVPFIATVEFEKPAGETSGKIILRKDNPSGLPENDDSLEIPIRFE